MALKMTTTATLSSERLVTLVVGESGIGKTSLAATLPFGKTLILSSENGLLCLKKVKDLNPKAVYDVWEISKMDELGEAFGLLSKPEYVKKYDNIFIDSLTEMGEKFLNELKNDPKFKDPKMALKMYGEYNDDFTAMVKAFRDLRPYSVFFTCLNSWEKDGMQMVEQFNFPGSKVKDNVKAWFDLVLAYKVFREGDKVYRKLITDVTINPLAKDRSGLLEQYEDADLSAIKLKILGR